MKLTDEDLEYLKEKWLNERIQEPVLFLNPKDYNELIKFLVDKDKKDK